MEDENDGEWFTGLGLDLELGTELGVVFESGA
jgi:hypothetical protein